MTLSNDLLKEYLSDPRRVVRILNRINRLDPDNQGHWFWEGYIDEDTGWGKIQYNGHDFKPHRVIYALFRGDIPDGYSVVAACGRSDCVNPTIDGANRSHLILKPVKGSKGLKSCKRGHLYKEGSYYLSKTGSKKCKLCYKSYNRVYRLNHHYSQSPNGKLGSGGYRYG